MTGFGGCHSHVDGLVITHFPEKDDVGALAERRTESCHVVFRVHVDLPLAHDGAFMAVQKFQRILQRDDMRIPCLIDVIDHAGQGCGFSAACRACNQNHAASGCGGIDDIRRNSQGCVVRQLEGDHTDHG